MNPCIPHHKVAHTLIISESEVSIMVLCLLCSPCYTAVRIKNCSKSMSVIKVVTMKNMDGAVLPSYHLKLKYPLPFFVSYVQLVTQKYKSRTVWKVPLSISVTQRKPSCATTKSTLFTVSKDEWNTKEDTGKPMKNAMHIQVLWYAKRHL